MIDQTIDLDRVTEGRRWVSDLRAVHLDPGLAGGRQHARFFAMAYAAHQRLR
jgi:hypothetical protein